MAVSCSAYYYRCCWYRCSHEPRRLHPAVFRHGQRFAIADNEVIEHPDVNQRECVGELAGQLAIGLTRLGDTGRVVMGLIVYAL